LNDSAWTLQAGGDPAALPQAQAQLEGAAKRGNFVDVIQNSGWPE
jgi:hypothetical protein